MDKTLQPFLSTEAQRSFPTPSLLIDKATALTNALWMKEKAATNRVKLRPHVKTHKTVELAQWQTNDNCITVSTLAEAEFFTPHLKDIFYAVPIIPEKMDRAVRLSEQGIRLRLLMDSLEICRWVLTQSDRLHGIEIMFAVDSGYGREGRLPQHAEMDECIRLLANSKLSLAGFATHGGHSYAAQTQAEREKIAHEEIDAVLEAKQRWQPLFSHPLKTSVGSTPTMCSNIDLHGITEIRPGNYFMFDGFMQHLGVCSFHQCAMRVSGRIIGIYPERNLVLTDTGSLVMSSDPLPFNNPGFGHVVGRPDWNFFALSQELGKIRVPSHDFKQLRHGDYVEIIPNHACHTAANFQHYHLVDRESVTQKLIPAKGW